MSLSRLLGKGGGEERKLQRERERFMAEHAADGFVNAPLEIIMRLDTATVNQLPTETLERLPRQKQEKLPPEALARLSTETLCQLPIEVIRRLPTQRLETLPASTLAGLSPGRLHKLSPPTLGRVLPELSESSLATLSWGHIASVDARQLANISKEGLACLATRHSQFYRLFEKLDDEQLLRLPPYILDKQFERVRKIPTVVWEAQPKELLHGLPLRIQSLVPVEVWGDHTAESELPTTVSAIEAAYIASSPAAPSFPVDVCQDDSITPKSEPPAIPPRAHKPPPLSYENQGLKRKDSLSASRSRTSSPSQDYRNQASRYMDNMLPPERRGSKGTKEWGDARENLPIRPRPPPPDGIPRKEVSDTHRELVELKENMAVKNKRIEELEAKLRDQEDWWKRRVDDESAKVLNLTVGTKSSTDRIFHTLATMAPNTYWDQSHPDPLTLLIKFSEDLNAGKQWQSSRIFEFLEGAAPQYTWDRSHPDPTDLIIVFARDLNNWKLWAANRIFDCLDQLAPGKTWDRTQLEPIEAIVAHLQEVSSSAQENFDTATYYRAEYSSEQEKNNRLENQLAAALRESREANDELATLRYSQAQTDKLLLKADAAKSDYEMKFGALRREKDELLRKVEHLQNNLANAQAHHEAQTQGIKQQNETLRNQMHAQKEDWAQKFKIQHDHYEGIRKNLEEALQQAEKKRQDDLKAKNDHFDQVLQGTRTNYENELKRATQAHQQELKNHSVNLQKKIESLESDLVDNSDDFRPATDDSLKTRYGSLKLLVETTTEPFNLGTVSIPQDGRFDPDNFLGREGKAQTRVLLRSIVWARLLDGFFSSPFGFGSFGPAEGKKLLLELYSAWRKLFGDGPLPVSGFHVPHEMFELFRTDKEANKWRSATFQSILMAVSPRGQKKNQVANGHLVKPFADNRQKVHDDILDIFNQVCKDGVSPEIAENIGKIVQQAGELALEFGSQRAELALDTPAKGESVTIGPEFVDWEDGESERGSTKEIDLLVLPKLFRVGDGRNDLKTRKIIVPGEIYPIRS